MNKKRPKQGLGLFLMEWRWRESNPRHRHFSIILSTSLVYIVRVNTLVKLIFLNCSNQTKIQSFL